jgi:hypothetical protein
VVPRGELLRRRQKGSRLDCVVERDREGCDEVVAVLECRHNDSEVRALALTGDGRMLGRVRKAQRSVAVVKARHELLQMGLSLGRKWCVGDCWPSWHRRKRNSDADGADKPCEALIACVRRQ